MSLKVAQAKNKKDVFNEIKSKYGKYERVGPKAEDKPRYWEEKNFTFIPPMDEWIGNLKPIAAVDVSLKFAGDRTNAGQFNVELKSLSKAGKEVVAPVGTIAETYK